VGFGRAANAILALRCNILQWRFRDYWKDRRRLTLTTMSRTSKSPSALDAGAVLDL